MLLYCGAVWGGGGLRENGAPCSALPAFSHFLQYPQANWSLLVLILRWVGPCTPPMVLSNELCCEAGSFSHCQNPYRFFQWEVLRLYFPALEPWVAQSVYLPSRSSQFIRTQMWDHLFHQPQPCHKSSPPHGPSPPLLLAWMNVFSLIPWLSDFHTIWFSDSSGYLLFLNLLLSFFWLCEEAQCVYLCLYFGQKLNTYC